MILINRDELVKKKGNIDISKFNIDSNEIFNEDEVINLLIDLICKIKLEI